MDLAMLMCLPDYAISAVERPPRSKSGVHDKILPILDRQIAAYGCGVVAPLPLCVSEHISQDAMMSPRRLAKAARRHRGGPMKCAYKVGQVGEPDIECHLGDRPRIVGE